MAVRRYSISENLFKQLLYIDTQFPNVIKHTHPGGQNGPRVCPSDRAEVWFVRLMTQTSDITHYKGHYKCLCFSRSVCLWHSASHWLSPLFHPRPGARFLLFSFTSYQRSSWSNILEWNDLLPAVYCVNICQKHTPVNVCAWNYSDNNFRNR